MGTFITEWDGGKKDCEELLRSPSAISSVTQQLALMAEYYGFDGWFINIENKIETDDVRLSLLFLYFFVNTYYNCVSPSSSSLLSFFPSLSPLLSIAVSFYQSPALHSFLSTLRSEVQARIPHGRKLSLDRRRTANALAPDEQARCCGTTP